RYGWIPETLPSDLVEREPWLKEHLNGKTSVTELEILHGVLNDPKMAGHAFFYFRDPKYVETVAADEKKNFIAENAKDAQKLSGLKEKIRQNKFPVRENYPDPKALGKLVLADLTKVINDNWPEGSQPDPLDRDAMDHEAYAQSRERVYIGRQEYFDRLDTHAAASDTQPLVILGESGSGKSALLANWVARYRQAHPDALVLQHYIGASPYSADWAAMLRRLMGEFKRRLGLQQDIPDQPDAMRSAFPNWLYMAAAKGRVVLVLDALNQLEDRDGAPDLVWLPPVLPENVRLIVSTLPGRPLDEIQKRHWPTLKVELLSADERRKLIDEYLAQHTKALNAARVERIAAAPPSANPLYLRVLLDELRLVRTHEELEERIGGYLKAESPYALYEKVIARWENDYSNGCNLVHDSLSLLWASRRGLSEAEILEALGDVNGPLPRIHWSPLFLAMDRSLINRSGLLNFSHEFLRQAVETKYLASPKLRRSAHLNVADYFGGVKRTRSLTKRICKLFILVKGPGKASLEKHLAARPVDELLWQLVKAESWQRLFETIRIPEVFKIATETSEYDIVEYWILLEKKTGFRANDFLVEMMTDKRADAHVLFQTAGLVGSMSNSASAALSYDYLAGYFERIGDRPNAQAALGNEARHLFESGQYELAREHFKMQEKIAREISHSAGLFNALTGLVGVLQKTGRSQEAMSMLNELRALAASNPVPGAEAICANTEAVLLISQHNLVGAFEKFKLAEPLLRAASMEIERAGALANLSLVAVELKDWRTAEMAAAETMTLSQRFNLTDLACKATGAMANVAFFAQHDLQKAFELFFRQETLLRDGKDLPIRLSCLLMQAACLMRLGRKAEALPIMERAFSLASITDPNLAAGIKNDIDAIQCTVV
ncbi:MAG: AAA family ATPase, partial [Candidatus Sulfotelmatobacter sp.]